jgi:hypothetical protein
MKVAKPLSNKEDMVFFNYVSIEGLTQGMKIRDIDDAVVDTLVESFKEFGVLEPITVVRVPNSGKYKVVVGHHRYLAFKRILETVPEADRSDFTLPAVIHTINEGDDTEAMQIAENLHRNDLSKEERKVMACRYLELIGQQAQNNSRPKKDSRPNGPAWFSVWYEATGIPKVSAQRMWDEFKVANGLGISPSKASVEQQQAFSAWHLEQAEQRKAAEAAKAQGDAEKARQEAAERELKEWGDKCSTVVQWLKNSSVPNAKDLLIAAINGV